MESTQSIDDRLEFRTLLFPPRYGSAVMKAVKTLNSTATPEESLPGRHLRLIRKHTASNQLEILLWTPPHDSEDQLKLQPFFDKYTASMTTATVPRWPAVDRHAFQTLSQLWPMVFHPEQTQEAKNLSSEELDEMQQHMKAFLAVEKQQHLKKCAQSGCVMNGGGRIVNPQTKETIDLCAPLKELEEPILIEDRPLHHISFQLIDVVAKVYKYQQQQQQLQDGQKKRKSNHLAYSKNPHDDREPDQVQYLCTGYDLYLFVEPCFMCAMALVHSRFRRIIYAIPNQLGGALETHCQLHTFPSLNHHYRVYRYSFDEESDEETYHSIYAGIPFF